eukprot:TRINITY_DN1846_c1_g1_i2.p1 TRINITY_DN1846_c1_g1~~TRINITY_DN1846_c1_g1_i2.p1  ORF type:complete len:127 (-),score=52.75 TRINITY_DN1846_c1_g1_i2:88-468(-)
MNMNLISVVRTSRDGVRFWQLPECYIRGCTIKYLCIAEEVIHKVHDEILPQMKNKDFRKEMRNRTRSRAKGRNIVGSRNNSQQNNSNNNNNSSGATRGGRGDYGRGGSSVARGNRGRGRGGRGGPQ